MDLAELGLAIDPSQVVAADKALDDFVDSAGSAEDAAKGFSKGAEDAGSASGRMADELADAEKGFNLLAVGIGAAVAALGTGFVMGITGAIGRIEEETKLLAQFDQVLQNTGNTADTTAETFKQFADELEDATGRAAEEILGVGANLASYGFDNEIFYSSIRLANDMSAAWGGDLKSSLEGLGRALDDPINGFAMLSKRGISLTDEQAKMVEQLVKSNKTFEAQAFIIETLADQVGGAAEAGFTGFAAATTRISKAIEGFFENIVEGTGLIDLLALGMNAAATAINFVSDNLDTLIAILVPVGAAIAVAFGPIALAAITSMTAAIAGPLLSAIGALTVAIMANPLGLLVAGVTAAVVAIWKFREELGLTDERLQAIGEVGSRVFAIISAAVSKLYEVVAPIISEIYDRLVSWGTFIVETLSPAFTALRDIIVPIFEEVWEWIDKVLSTLEDLLGIIPKVKSATNSTQNQSSSASGNIDKKINDALSKGGDSASKKMKEGVSKGGMTAAEALNKAQAGSGRGMATALEKANASGAKALSKGVADGGNTAAAAITAAGQVMAAKFEGTGRNIYDLWNNWGDAFIDGFGTSVGKLLVDFQRAQTNLLREQRLLVKEQTENLRIQNDLLRRGKNTPDSPTSERDTTKTSKLSFDLGTPTGDSSLDKYTSGQNSSYPREISREIFSPAVRNLPEAANRNEMVKLTIINKVDPRDSLNAMTTRQGREVINNLISQSPDVLSTR